MINSFLITTHLLTYLLTYYWTGQSRVSLDCEHVGDASAPLWRLFHLYQQFFENFSVSKFLKTGIILPLFKGKGAKANNNYIGITPFHALSKIY